MPTKVKKLLHEVRFPGESDQYRQARDELLKAEIDLRRQVATVAAQRRKLPLGGPVPRDYTFEEWDPGTNAARPVRGRIKRPREEVGSRRRPAGVLIGEQQDG